MAHPIFALMVPWLFLIVPPVGSLRIFSSFDGLDHYSAPEENTECTCRDILFLDIGLGASGGESLKVFFKTNHFQTVFWKHGGNDLSDILRSDWDAKRYQFPLLQRAVAETKKGCGNVFVGDLKIQKVLKENAKENAIAFSRGSIHPHHQFFQALEHAFPSATWIWLIRHPDAWATSKTHWRNIENADEANEFLQKLRRSFNYYHCGVWEYFGNRTIGNPDGIPGQKKDAVLLNLEKLDFPLFIKQLNEASGHQCLPPEGDMPHVGHHPPTWEYPAADRDKWNSWEYLKNICNDATFDATAFNNMIDAENPFD